MGDTEHNHLAIQTVVWLWLLCFVKDIFAYNSIMKVKLKILEHVNRFFFNALSAVFLIMSVACSGAEPIYITLFILDVIKCHTTSVLKECFDVTLMWAITGLFFRGHFRSLITLT